MRGKADHASQAAAIARIAEVAAYAPILREHLHDILESSAFRGSRRSQEFLKYAVENALEGRFDNLKERTLGIELFGRPATYDTGEDSIVRVSASDVRKRLVQYYSESGQLSDFRIELPSGSYIPEFRRVVRPAASPEPLPITSIVETVPAQMLRVAPPSNRRAVWGATLCVVIGVAATVTFWAQSHRTLKPGQVLPWSVMFDGDHRTNIIVSDTCFGAIQDLLNTHIPLSDYASQHYPPQNLNPEVAQAVNLLMKRQFTAVPDVGIAVSVAGLAQLASQHVAVRSARSLHIQDFRSDDNFILLGSARTNPWNELFDKQLDFVIEYDSNLQKTICRNRNPKQGETPVYIPTAVSFATGDAYAVVALISNPNQSGHILFIEGTTGEGTEMAGKFVTNLDQFSNALQRAGIKWDGPKRFQLLMRLQAMAGSPNNFEVIAFHSAPDALSH